VIHLEPEDRIPIWCDVLSYGTARTLVARHLGLPPHDLPNETLDLAAALDGWHRTRAGNYFRETDPIEER
jgi:hypothetical protein